MSDEEVVIPFRPRPRTIAEGELDAVRQMTRNWHPELRELMFPEHAKLDRARSKDE
jgi:hypothetical protein